eukprot:690081_1
MQHLQAEGHGSRMEEVQSENRWTNEEYKAWKKNAPFMYDFMLTHALEWPSLTVQWFPDRRAGGQGRDYTLQRVLLGTSAGDGEPNQLIVGEVKMPVCEDEMQDGSAGESAPVAADDLTPRLEVIQTVNHETEVHRARFMPQNPNVVATNPNTEDVLIFDLSKHAAKGARDGISVPDARLRGHHKEGYGLAWNHHAEGQLVSGSRGPVVCMWDINAAPTPAPEPSSGGSGPSIAPLARFEGHTDMVEDVAWSCHHKTVFGSCSDDRKVMIWDTRAAGGSAPSQTIQAHSGEVNCLDFSPFMEHLFVSGSADQTIALWDLRNVSKCLHRFDGHKGQVFNVEWSPSAETVMASCGTDARVIVWDLARIGAQQTAEKAQDGPPEMVFLHGGHTERVTDFSWNPNEEWTIASVAENAAMQVWSLAEHIYLETADEVGELPAGQPESVNPIVST